MKNIVARLTIRHMLLNKKRTVVTILGVIISVAMIMAVSTIAYSFTSYMGENAMNKTGDFHVVFEGVPYEKREEVFEGKNIESSFYGKLIGNFELSDMVLPQSEEEPAEEDSADEEGDTSYKQVYRLIGLDDDDISKIYFGNIDGYYPSDDTEIMMSSYYASGMNISAGDEIELGGNKYTVSGIYDVMDIETKFLDIEGQFTYCMFTSLDNDNIGQGDYINIYSVISDLGMGIYDDIEKIAEASECETYITNRDVLYYYGIGDGRFGQVMSTIKYILIAVISAGAVALISNGFSISLSERSKYLGMLASVGATKAQKRYSVFFEGFIVGIISIPLGILSGYAGTVITFKVIEDKIYTLVGNDASPVVARVQPWVIITAVIFSILTIFLSAYLPARRASRISPVDAIRQTRDIRIKSSQVKTHRLTRKMFGFEGELALKNLKRNKKRYAITLLSLIVSIVLFLSVYAFVYYITDSAEMVYNMSNFDVYGGINNVDNSTRERIENEINAGADIGEASFKSELLGIPVMLDGESTKKYTDASYISYHEDASNGEKPANLDVNIITYDSVYMKKYLESIGISYESFVSDSHNAIALNSGAAREYYDKSSSPTLYEYKYLDIAEGSSINILINKTDNPQESESDLTDKASYKDEISLNILAAADDSPLGADKVTSDVMPIIVTNELYRELIDNAYDSAGIEKGDAFDYGYNEFSMNFFYILGGDKDTQYKTIHDIVERNNGDMWGYSIYEEKKEGEDMLFLVQVFTYGFIVLMTLVCTANIFNTISTSVMLRKREFATLRSVGMTKKSFNRMIFFESGFYGIKALLYGIPISIAIIIYMYTTIAGVFDSGFSLPWSGIMIVAAAVFLLVGSAMIYASSKIKKENIIDGLKDENI